jgi:hypothetical protein
MSALPRWVKRLAVGEARLCPVPDGSGAYAVFPRGDLRRRPTARLTADEVRTALAEGWLNGCDASGYRLAYAPADLADRRGGAFQRPHQQIRERVIAEAPGTVTRHDCNMATSPLARWARPRGGAEHGWLSAAEFEAGERLRDDFHRSTLSERVTSDWSGYLAPGSGGSGRSPEAAPASALAAKTRVQEALAAVGPGFDRVLSSVCLRECGLEDMERDESWPRRSGKVVLKLALQRLARFYGLPA